MYYLLNEGNQIIGADKKFINYLNLTDLDSFRSAILLNEMKIVKTNNIVSIETKEKRESYFFSESEAETIIGSFKLIYLNEIVEEEKDVNPNIINFSVFAERVGLDEDDYLDFVQEFIELSIELKETIFSSKKDIYKNGIEKIVNLSEILYLTSITKDLTNIDNLNKVDKKKSINKFYDRLNDLLNVEDSNIINQNEQNLLIEDLEELKEGSKDSSIDLNLDEMIPKDNTDIPKEVEIYKDNKQILLDLDEDIPEEIEIPKENKKDSIDLDLDEDILEEIEMPKEKNKDSVDLNLEEEIENIDEKIEENYVRKGFSLDDVESVHFDFQISKAANELGIPEDIIAEFVEEYIEQAETETVNLIEAYRKDDLKTIQEIGHLLKGAASNLRIEPLAETLYDLQFCENIELIEGLTKKYWAKFLSLKSQINK